MILKRLFSPDNSFLLRASSLVKLVLSLGIFMNLGTGIRAGAADTKGDAGYLLVANKGDNSLGIIDPAAGRQIAVVALDGITGHEVAASPDGKHAYVPIFGSGGVGGPGTDGQLLRKVDIANTRVVGTLDFGKGVRPHCAQI